MDLCEEIKARQGGSDIVLLSFSNGKDSIAAWIVLKELGFKVKPFFYYLVPDLKFQTEALEYYSDKFGEEILCLPSAPFLNLLTDAVFQTKEDYDMICRSMDVSRTWKREDIELMARQHFGIPNSYMAVGITEYDSVIRRISLRKNGPINDKAKKFYPIHNLSRQDIYDLIKKHRIRLPKDYYAWGQSLDGINVRWVEEIKGCFPEDWKKVKLWFPLIDIEIHRKRILGEMDLLLRNSHKKHDLKDLI